MTSDLSPTTRSRPRREKERARSDRQSLYDVLDASLICHLAVAVDRVPLALPTVFAVDRDGPDLDGTLYLHGSVASRSLVQGPDQDVSVTFTLLDGMVLARSGFNHSMNYRSAVVIGRPRVVTDPDERDRAFDLIVDHAVPGRSAELRRPTRKELAATTLLALSLHEASVKISEGDPGDEDFDIEAGGVWAGVIPLRLVAGEVVTGADVDVDVVPAHVAARASSSGRHASARQRPSPDGRTTQPTPASAGRGSPPGCGRGPGIPPPRALGWVGWCARGGGSTGGWAQPTPTRRQTDGLTKNQAAVRRTTTPPRTC